MLGWLIQGPRCPQLVVSPCPSPDALSPVLVPFSVRFHLWGLSMGQQTWSASFLIKLREPDWSGWCAWESLTVWWTILEPTFRPGWIGFLIGFLEERRHGSQEKSRDLVQEEGEQKLMAKPSYSYYLLWEGHWSSHSVFLFSLWINILKKEGSKRKRKLLSEKVIKENKIQLFNELK